MPDRGTLARRNGLAEPDGVVDDNAVERAFRRATTRVPRKARLAHTATVGRSVSVAAPGVPGGGAIARADHVRMGVDARPRANPPLRKAGADWRVGLRKDEPVAHRDPPDERRSRVSHRRRPLWGYFDGPPVDTAHGPATAVRLAKPKASRVPVGTISPECFQLNHAPLRNALTPASTRSGWAARQIRPEACRRWSSRHARSPWEAQRPPVPTGPDRRSDRATPRSRTRRGIPATRPATPGTGPAAPGASAPRRPTAVAATSGPPAGGPDPGLAGLPPLPITRLPLRARQRHNHSTPLRNGPVTGGSAPGRSRHRASAGSTAAALQRAGPPDNHHAGRRAAWGGTGA